MKIMKGFTIGVIGAVVLIIIAHAIFYFTLQYVTETYNRAYVSQECEDINMLDGSELLILKTVVGTRNGDELYDSFTICTYSTLDSIKTVEKNKTNYMIEHSKYLADEVNPSIDLLGLNFIETAPFSQAIFSSE